VLSFSHQVFIEVASNLSFSKAANILFITQPAISKHVKALESFYKCALFERTSHQIRLTPTGETLFKHLKEALQIQQKIQFEISTAVEYSRAEGNLRIGASTTVALYIIPPMLSAFHRAQPLLNIQLMNRNSENITKALLTNEIDIGIVEVDQKIISIAYTHFMSDQVIPVCSSKSEIAKFGEINADHLKKLPIAIRERGSGTLTALEKGLKGLKVTINDLQVKVRLGGTEALKNFLLADQCIGFLPRRSVMKELAKDELRELRIPNLEMERNFYFIQRQGSVEAPLNRHFIKFAHSFYNQKL
jgi:DNA-binding transcriptional LysR family regulator